MRFEAVSVGSAWLDQNVPCTQACPVLTKAGRYVSAIAVGDDDLAYLTARMPNPFPSICGRVCAAPCEIACRRGTIDEPIAIRALKRFACEHAGVESGEGDRMWRRGVGMMPARDQRVAVIGSGPAGMACAHDLAAYGYRPVVFEAQDRPGGMMVLGIPTYRLRRDILQAEIRAILDLGVELRTGQRLGRDFSLRSLRDDGFAAAFVAVGAMQSRDLQIPGHDLDGVLKAVDFLINANLGYRVELGDRVLVIGGGNVALDAARTALRDLSAGLEGVDGPSAAASGADAASTAAFDAARVARRLGAREVSVVALESRTEMPAHEFEIEEAEREGIGLVHRRGPRRIVGDGSVAGLETVRVASVFDADGRFNPTFVEGTESVIPCDSVILAIGQTPDLSWLQPDDGVEVSRRGTIAIDAETLATASPFVFSGGDVAFGPRNLIDAIGDGRRAAASIHRQLAGDGGAAAEPRSIVRRPIPIEVIRRPLLDYDGVPRVEVPSVPSERRVGVPEIELGYTQDQARAEASRCLQCFLNIWLDVDLCILCGGCVDVCPEYCIRIVSAQELTGVDAEGPASALILQEDRCIRCALCIERCPTDALSMVRWDEVSTDLPALELQPA